MKNNSENSEKIIVKVIIKTLYNFEREMKNSFKKLKLEFDENF